MYFRHESFRKYQDKLIKDVSSTLNERGVMLAHAPMGLGKTDAVLSPSISKALEEGLTVFFLTPKISQHKIALDVVEGINKKYGLKIKAVDLVGRKYMCIHPSLISLDHDNFYTMCKRLREDEICNYYGKAVGYNKVQELEANSLFNKFNKSFSIFSHYEVMDYGKENEACPYELLVKASREADIIIADYYHLFIKGVRESFFKKSRKKLEKCIVIVDEAHNLPSRVRSHLSKSLNEFMLLRAEKEMEFIGFDKIKLSNPFKNWAKKELDSKAMEKMISKESLLDVFNEHNIEELISLLEEIGVNYSKVSSRSSYSLRVASFLKTWMEESIGEIRILKKGKFFSVSKRMLDPSLSTSLLNKTYSSILMSGTLLPLEMYKDVLGLENAKLKAYDSPFPERNRLLMISKGLTTRYSKRDEEMYKKYAEEINLIFQNSPGGVAVFFPSFKVLEGVEKHIKVANKLKQKPSMKPEENQKLINKFKSEKSLLLGVQGGSLSEGVDFNNGEIKVLVVAGLALDEMTLETKALIDYYQDKFGKGMDYGYVYPAITKALQSTGRAIRREEDKAVIIFMDERFSWSNYFKLLPAESYIITHNPSLYVKKFFTEEPFSYV